MSAQHATSAASAPDARLAVRVVRYDDPVAKPLLDDLELEYDTRYARPDREPSAIEIHHRYPATAFAAEGGGHFLLLETDDGDVVAGGAFMPPSERAREQRSPRTGHPIADELAVEVKRIWTHRDHRRRGYATQVMAELEAEAGRRRIPAIILSTGPKQPEAVGLYLSIGYTPLFDVEADPETVSPLYFYKALPLEP